MPLNLTVHDEFSFKLDRLDAVLPPGMRITEGDADRVLALVIDDPDGTRHVYCVGPEERAALATMLRPVEVSRPEIIRRGGR